MRWFLSVLALSSCAATPSVDDGGCVAPSFLGAIDNARSIACGKIFRGAVPSSSAVCDSELKTVIDLRVPSERQSVPDAACLADRMVLAPMAIPYNVSAADYLADLDEAASVRAVFEVLGDESRYPVFFHCTYGRDRSGVVAALVLLALGASREEIMRDYLRSTESGLSVTPASLDAVLNRIEERGGIDAQLALSGVPPAAVATLRANAKRP